MEFAAAFPSLMHDGVPLSWRHFVYGMAHLSRAHARESIRLASTIGAVFGDKADQWFSTMESHAGWK